MATITRSEGGFELPDNQCSECDMRFNIAWGRNPVYEDIEFCPFCGEEIDEIELEDE